MGSYQAFYAIGMIGMIIPMARCFHPNGQSHWDDSIPRDGGWLPHWDEALDESHWLCFSHSGGLAPPQSENNKVTSTTGKTRPLLVVGMNFIPRPLAIGMRFIPMDGGCLPHWDEALDESTGIIEAVYFAI